MANTLQANQIADAIITAPGQIIEITEGQRTSTLSIDASPTYTQVAPVTGAFDVEVAYTATYLVFYNLELSNDNTGSTTATTKHKLVFDEGEANEQTIGDDDTWQVRTSSNDYVVPVFKSQVVLTSGSHTLKVYATKIDGTADARLIGSSVVPVTAPKVTLIASTGSGAGGMLVEETIGSDVTLLASSGTSTTVISQSINASSGDKLLVHFYCRAQPSSTAKWQLYGTLRLNSSAVLFKSDGITGANWIHHKRNRTVNSVDSDWIGNTAIIDAVAGNNTVSVNLVSGILTGGSNVGINDPRLTVAIIRGGLVPVYDKNDSLISSTPHSWKFDGGLTVSESSGQVTVTGDLSYLSTTPPSGATAPVAVYQFDDSASDLTDRTGNGYDLTLNGSFDVHTRYAGLTGRMFDGSTTALYRSSNDAALTITGELTLEAVVVVSHLNDIHGLISFAEDGETEATNIVYLLRLLDGSTLSYFAEHSSGTNTSYDSKAGVQSGIPVHLCITRDSAGTTTKFYVQGQLIDEDSSVTATTGGTSSKLGIGGKYASGGGYDTFFKGTMFSARITAAEYTAAQVLEAAQQVNLA